VSAPATDTQAINQFQLWRAMTRRRRIALIVLLGGLATGTVTVATADIWLHLADRRLEAMRADCEQRVPKLVDRWASDFQAHQVKVVRDDPAFAALTFPAKEAIADYILSQDPDWAKFSDADRNKILRRFLLVDYTGKALPFGYKLGPLVPNEDLLPGFESSALHTPSALAAVLCDPLSLDAPEEMLRQKHMRIWVSDNKWFYFGVVVFCSAVPWLWYFILARLREVSDAVRGMDN
jgi:hypothetical protein